MSQPAEGAADPAAAEPPHELPEPPSPPEAESAGESPHPGGGDDDATVSGSVEVAGARGEDGATGDAPAHAPEVIDDEVIDDEVDDDEVIDDGSPAESGGSFGETAAGMVVPSTVSGEPRLTVVEPLSTDGLDEDTPDGEDASAEPADVAAPDSAGVSAAARRTLPRAVAIANQKGGVGKTTTAVNLGAALAELGYRVLVVDLDPQGNATTGLGVNPRSLANSVYDVLMSDTPLDDCIEPTSMRNLFVVPATIDLAGAEIELVPAFSRELKLRRAIDSLDGAFDFTLIDCPPSLGLLTVNGLAAAGEVLVPIQCEYYALEGLGQLLKNIQLVQSNLNPRLELSTIVLTMYDARTRLADQVAKEVREHFGPKVCRTIVPRTVRLSEAPSFGQPINVFDPTSRGATAYRELAKEVSGGEARRAG